MKHIRALILINGVFLLVLFLSPLTWIFTSKGIDYLSMLSGYGKNFFYLKMIICVTYSVFICSMLLNFKKLGIRLIVPWNLFVGLYLLIIWIGGHFMLKFYYGMDVVFDVSLISLMKGGVGISLLIFGLIFKTEKIAKNFH